MEFQVRFEDGELHYFPTLKEAFQFANYNSEQAWKVSFTIPETNERVRLISRYDGVYNQDNSAKIIWIYEPIIEVL